MLTAAVQGILLSTEVKLLRDQGYTEQMIERRTAATRLARDKERKRLSEKTPIVEVMDRMLKEFVKQ